MRYCSERSYITPVLIAIYDSKAAVTAKAQQLPQYPWFLTGETLPDLFQLTEAGTDTRWSSSGTALLTPYSSETVLRYPVNKPINTLHLVHCPVGHVGDGQGVAEVLAVHAGDDGVVLVEELATESVLLLAVGFAVLVHEVLEVVANGKG